MRIAICSVSVQEGRCRVEFSSALGRAWAYWHGDPPILGLDYNVEIDLPSVTSPGFVVYPASDMTPAIRTDEASSIILQGIVALGADDESMSLQLGNDTILLDGVVGPFRSDSLVAIVVPSITLYPFSL